jgi:hypothetical protein
MAEGAGKLNRTEPPQAFIAVFGSKKRAWTCSGSGIEKIILPAMLSKIDFC